MYLKEIALENMQSINQAQKRNKWWALVNTVMITGLQTGAEDSLNG
jgi:L-rhamnose mutarotase